MLFSPQHQTVPSARGKISGSDTLPEHDQCLVRVNCGLLSVMKLHLATAAADGA